MNIGGGRLATAAVTGGLLAAGLALGACERPAGSAGDSRPAGTVRMAALLDSMARTVHPDMNEFANAARLARLEARGVAPEPQDEALRQALMAQELLRVGRTADALQRFAVMDSLRDEYGLVPTAEFRSTVAEVRAIAGLRLGGMQACLETRGPVPCLFPIPPERAVESAPTAAAIAQQLAFLEEAPDDWRARWLLNLGHMMRGTWPDGVPAEHLIPPAAFASEADPGAFEDVAPELGIDVLGHAGAAVLEDFDGDGRRDLLASSRGFSDPLRFFRRDERGGFEDRTIEAGLEGLYGGLNMVPADYDNDGLVDVLVLRGGWLPRGWPNSLLRNAGDGRFEDVTVEAGLLSLHPTQAGAWGDYDNDGWLDLYIGNESNRFGRHVSELYRNQGDGTFREVAASAGVDVVGFVKGVAWGDYDDDGRPDLYVSRFREPNLLLRNDGPGPDGGWRFSDVTAEAGVAEPLASFPTWFWDYDNDGHEDLFVSGYFAEVADLAREAMGEPHTAEVPRLYRNLGDGRFEDVTRRVRLDRIMYSMGASFGDLDNDGWLDLYVGTGDPHFRQLMPNRMFRSAGAETFQEVTTASGFGHLGKGHGIAFGDFDGDGDQDIYAVLGGAYEGDLARNALFRNPGHGNRWLTLELEGVESNRAAIGARVHVVVEEGGVERSVYATAGSGGSFGANTLQVELGLGQATAIRQVQITWPASGRRDRYQGLALDAVYRIREGAEAAERLRPELLGLGP